LTAAGLVAVAAAGGALIFFTASTDDSQAAATTTSTHMSMGGMPMPVPIQPVGHALWQGMSIKARLSTPVPFVIFEGTRARMIKPAKNDDVHLMVMVNDAKTGMAIPYGSVWATVRMGSKIVFDERLWPMISRYMGTHFGNNVALPGTGAYTLTLLIGPPQAARHMEYSNVWLKPHRVTMTFHWRKPQ
jgi:hypothetical protein